MAYSIVHFSPLTQARRTEYPTIDGDVVIQELGLIDTEIWIYHWITTDELQARIAIHEAAASDGWVIVGDIARNPIHEALDLFNAQITMHRYKPS